MTRSIPRLALAAFLLSLSNARGVEPATVRSPIALAISNDGGRVLTANRLSGTTSMVDLHSGLVVGEVAVGSQPMGVAWSRDGKVAVVTDWAGGDLAILDVKADGLAVVGRVALGPEPRGVAIAPDGKSAYVALGIRDEVARVDLSSRTVTGRVKVGREPRGLAITPDGSKLLVGNARSKSLNVIDVLGWAVEQTAAIDGDNLRQIAIDAAGKLGYVANMRNRGFATTKNNIDLGWVLGQRLTRVTLDGSEPYETLSLDPQGLAAGDAHGVALSADGKYLAVSCGGTHEVMLFKADGKPLPWRPSNSRDLMAAELLKNDGRFRRVALGGRPTELAFAPDSRTLAVANDLSDSIQVVDAESGTLTATIPLAAPSEPSLARRGEFLFHDAVRSFNQWYSCNTCHSDGHTNGLNFDTSNDGWQDLSTAHARSRKKVPTLRGVARTGPWTWHGWQEGLVDAVTESFTKSMQGPKPTTAEVAAMVAYLGTLDHPANPNRSADGSPTEAARRGETVFRSAAVGCATCHKGPEFTDGKIHVVGLEERGDVYKGYNPPSLVGVYDKGPYLHDGRSATLREALAGPHSPEAVLGNTPLGERELDDLVAYLESL